MYREAIADRRLPREPAAGGLMAKLFDQDGDGDLDLGDALKGLGRLF